MMPKRCLIIGAGYLGVPLAEHLEKSGREIVVWSYSEETVKNLREQHPLWQTVHGDVAEDAAWASVPTDITEIIHCASSGRGGEEAYARVFVAGWRQIAARYPQARLLFVSSTSVYGQQQGEVVTENSVAESNTATGKLLREAEEIARSAGGIVGRSAGIYGPERGVLFEKLRRGEAIIEGDGSRWMNQIHRDDLVAAIAHLLDRGMPGEVYNACDDEPVSHLDYYRWGAAYLGRELPPFGPVNLARKRGVTNKRVINAKLKVSGWSPRYPSFREGISAAFPL